MALFRHCCGVDCGLTVDDCGGLKENRMQSGELAAGTLKNIRGRVLTIKNAFGDLPNLSGCSKEIVRVILSDCSKRSWRS